MMRKTSLLLLLTISLFCSCNYRLTFEKDSKGKRHIHRDFKDNDLEQRWKTQAMFRHKYGYMSQEYPKYQAGFKFDNTYKVPFIQYDSTRVYLIDSSSILKALFAEKLLSPQIIYCCVDSTCKTIKEHREVRRLTGEQIIYNKRGWSGAEINISVCEVLQRTNTKANQRRLAIHLTFNDAVQATYVLFIELTNNHANRHTNINDFIKGATLTFIRQAWIEI